MAKYGEDGEIIIQIELPIFLGNTQTLKQSEIHNINTQWTLEERIQSIVIRELGWNFQRINSMKLSHHFSSELN